MVTSYSVNCMLCSRLAGKLVGRTFVPAPGAPAPANRNGRLRCGFCSGSLYLEPDALELGGLDRPAVPASVPTPRRTA